MRRLGPALAGILALAATGCGDDDDTTTDAGSTGDAGNETTGGEGGANGDDDGGASGDSGNETSGDGGNETNGDGGSTAGESFAAVSEEADVIVSDVNGLSGITYAADGKIYATGLDDDDDDDTTTDDIQIVVVRFNADGSLDSSFGTDGVVEIDQVTDGEEAGIAVVELGGDHDIVVAANVPDATAGQDVVLFRLDADGDLVTSWGDNGALVVDFGWTSADDASWPTGGETPSDTVYDLELDATGSEEKLVVMGYGAAPYDASAATQRTDDDRYIVRLMASDGSIDPGFNGGEVFSWDNGGGYEDDSRRGLVESDGAIVSSGYTEYPTEGDSNHVMLLRLLPDGTLDTSFGFGFPSSPDGATAFNPFLDDGGMAEAYGVVQLSDGTYVTTGYGNATEPTTGNSSMGYATTQAQDLVAFGVRADGTGLSDDFGKNGSGAWAYQSEEEASPQSFEERGRQLAALPDDRVAHVGRYGGLAAIYIALPDGALDEDQGEDGIFTFDSGSVTEQFFDVAVSADGSRIAAVTRGFDAAGSRLAILGIAE